MNLALVQIRSIPTGPWLPSPSMLLFNRLIKGLLPQMNRKPIIINYDDVQYEVLKACHDIYVKNNEAHKDSLSFPIASTVPMQHVMAGSWTHIFIKAFNSSDHRGRSYMVRVKKTCRLITWNMRHICNTQ